VLFPAFAAGATRPERLAALSDRAIRVICLLLFPFTFAVVALAPEALGFWLGADFAEQSTAVLRWLSIGVLVNSIGWVPFSMLQGIGRPDITAKIHLCETPLYLAALFYMTANFGIEGAAVAWALRLSFETTILLTVAERYLPRRGLVPRRSFIAATVGASLLAGGWLIEGFAARAVFLGVGLVVFAWIGWSLVLNVPERQIVRRLVPIGRSHGIF
jgi:O-antigen/teichoic acid export membrane protein